MSRKHRVKFSEEHLYHITSRGNNKADIFLFDEDKAWFEKKARIFFERHDITVDSLCIMNSHLHLLIKPSDDSDVSKMMQGLCSSYSLHYNHKYKHIGHVFQGRFKAKEVSTVQGVLNVREYIQQNPVKADYCDKPGNYRWLWSEGLRSWGSDPHSKPTAPPV